MSTMLAIATEVAQKHGLAVGDLRGSCLLRPVVLARHEAFAAIYATGKFSYPQIGRLFNRDHTSVLYGVRRHAERQSASGAAQ